MISDRRECAVDTLDPCVPEIIKRTETMAASEVDSAADLDRE